MGCPAFCDTVLSFLRKFFSLIIAILMAVITVLYVVGVGIVVTGAKSFGKSGFAHFLGILFAIVTVIGYIILHFVPRKAYRLLYALTFILLTTMFLVAHSWGLAAPVVQDCQRNGNLHINTTWGGIGSIGTVLGEDNVTITIGSLGEPIAQCNGNAILFAAAFLNMILYVIALFDIQTVLLARVKSKTYGERFVEMGISN
ncbi:hypothetical protein ABB37_08170 [Leptomonas pyrrhocoris]|uniref:MARVEL domain-containing protein n=1 Tax=Leptomonas pyrrhocoris TaxID=157538 RepID=A0A0N0VDM3_LEPPY|nr:hypothetical protein ABB37_08170 [Leptomonas pyrrhocoris]KPA76028.1 hypothetical protein ABB37_08170 [Leptomonas pyrrhocoris]|eukprot:XP_015654467.1 hypothetical protein ABB37_08170 [Leptomonas pyrrhocoris]